MFPASIFLASLPSPGLPPPKCVVQRAAVEGGQIAYRDCGRGAVVLIVPGGPGLDAEYVAPVARVVTDTHRRAIVVEPRGTGASRAAMGDGSQLTVAGSIADIEAVRRASGADKVILLGHSFGGAVVQAYAAAFPQHVAGLILLDSTGPDMKASNPPLDSWRTRATADELARYDAARKNGDRVAAMRLKFKIGFYDRQRGEAFDAALKDSYIHSDVGVLASAYVREYRIAPAKDAAFPVTIMAGDIDWIRGSEPALQSTYPAARTLIVPHAGHFPWADAPQAFRDALKRALKAR